MVLNDAKDIFTNTDENLRSQFELVSTECNHGKHCIISVSGFLSEKDNNIEAWSGITKNNPMLPVYSYRWASNGIFCLLNPVKGFLIPQFSIKSALRHLLFVYKVGKFAFDYRSLFTNSVKIAKISGKLLAHALMLQFPLECESVSLVGFSLGTQVIYSCLEELKKYNYDNIINNVYFLGGAVNVHKDEEWAETLQIPRGSIYNGYCTKDYILLLYKASMFKQPIGLGPLFILNKVTDKNKDIHSRYEKIKKDVRINNVDVTSEAYGHVFYRSRMDRVLDKMEFCG